MGTRHRQCVIDKEGNLKISQYGQWDGYPSGQGVEILEYLKKGDLNKYQEELSKIKEITDEQIDIVNSDPNWKRNYPYLSRDCGSRIHEMIENGEVKFVQFIDDEEANQWCEGFYTIDFQKGEFNSKFYGRESTYPIDSLPTKEEYIYDMVGQEEE